MNYAYVAEWREYADWTAEIALDDYFRHQNRCPSCDGWGDHGVEEETNCLYTCYGCGGTGRYHVYQDDSFVENVFTSPTATH